MRIDSVVLLDLLRMVWSELGHPEGLVGTLAAEEFERNYARYWMRIFRLEHLQGIQVPGAAFPPGIPTRRTTREFGFSMSTDGVGCSFTCRRPRRVQVKPYTPQTVPYDMSTTVFKSIDPGMTDIVVGVEPELVWSVQEPEVDIEGRRYVESVEHTFINELGSHRKLTKMISTPV
jgi:hypothetical protein